MTFEEIVQQFKTARALLLLRAKNAPFVISFLQRTFSDANVTTISNGELRSKLEGYIEELSYDEGDEELDAESLFNDFAIRAAQYIERWSNNGYLRKYPGDDGEDLHELTPDTIKVLMWLEDLVPREYIGTNSRFKDIFFKLQKMVEQTNEDPESRIEELEKKLQEPTAASNSYKTASRQTHNNKPPLNKTLTDATQPTYTELCTHRVARPRLLHRLLRHHR